MSDNVLLVLFPIDDFGFCPKLLTSETWQQFYAAYKQSTPVEMSTFEGDEVTIDMFDSVQNAVVVSDPGNTAWLEHLNTDTFFNTLCFSLSAEVMWSLHTEMSIRFLSEITMRGGTIKSFGGVSINRIELRADLKGHDIMIEYGLNPLEEDEVEAWDTDDDVLRTYRKLIIDFAEAIVLNYDDAADVVMAEFDKLGERLIQPEDYNATLVLKDEELNVDIDKINNFDIKME
jgi:hypothetical protein